MTQSFLISGAGSGIGRAIAQTLARQGHRIVALGRTEKTLKETLESLTGDNHSIAVADIRDRAQLKAAYSKTQLTHLRGLIVNAGVGGENHYDSQDRWQEIIDTNLTGSYNFIQEALPYFEETKSDFRHIVIVSSILARLGVPGYSAYCASKAGLLGLMRSLAVEYASHNILTNAICPGWVDTAMARQGLELMAEAQNKNLEDVHREQMSYVLLGKMSTPQEIANFVKWLVSDDHSSITGQVFDINNGALMPS